MEYKITLENLELQHELREYILELEEEGKSPKTILNYRLWIQSFFKFLLLHPETSGIKKIQPAEYYEMFPLETGEKLENSHEKVKTEPTIYRITRPKLTATRFQKFLHSEKQKNSTVNLKTIALNSFFNFCNITERDKRGRDIPLRIKTLEISHRHSIEDSHLMEIGDYYKLLEVVDHEKDPRAYALFLFLFNTGARISEALSVDIENIEKVGNGYKVAIRGKRGKVRDIDFNQETYEALEKFLKRTDRDFKCRGALFTTYKRFLEEDSQNPQDNSLGTLHRLSPKMADWIVKKYAGRTKLPRTKFFSHNFRHLIAKTLLDQGTSLDKVKNFLGHTNISTTALYTMGKASELREVKSRAMRSARIQILEKKYRNCWDIAGILVDALSENPRISDAKLAELLGTSKASFSRKHRKLSEEIRGEFLKI
ncbi:MAG: tyrosine-type recombinase/integrase [Fusobacteriaceae bacterium]